MDPGRPGWEGWRWRAETGKGEGGGVVWAEQKKNQCISNSSVSQGIQTTSLLAMLNLEIPTFTCFVVIPTVSGGSGWPRPGRGVMNNTVWAEKEYRFVDIVIYR